MPSTRFRSLTPVRSGTASRRTRGRKGRSPATAPARPRLDTLEPRDLPASVLDLGTLGGDFAWAYGLNAAGHVVGGSERTGGDSAAFLYRDGGMIDLGILAGHNSTAYGINAADQVVGSSETGMFGSDHAFLWEAATGMRDLGTLGGRTSQARGINDAGDVVGSAAIAGNVSGHAFLYRDGVMVDLGTAAGARDSAAVGINNAGDIVGDLDFGTGVRHAFVYRDGVMTDLGTLGGLNSEATAINDVGDVVGEADLADGDQHAFLYRDGVMTDLGTLGGSYGRATGINNAGQVVGRSSTADGLYEPFVWDEADGMRDLNSLIPAAFGWDLGVPAGINDQGQIAGYGDHNGQTHPYLFDPAGCTWVNPAGGAWEDAANWDANQVPTADCRVVIPYASITVTHAVGTDAVRSLTSEATLAVSGGSLTISGTSTVHAGVRITGGTLQADGDLSADTLTMAGGDPGGHGGTLTGAGTVTVEALTWTDGTMSGTGRTVVRNGLTIMADHSFPVLDGRTLDNAGTARLGAGQGAVIWSAGVFNNLPGAVFSFGGLYKGGWDGTGAVVFNNAGTVRKDTDGISPTPQTFPATLNNAGRVEVTQGTMVLAYAGALGGTFTVAGATGLWFDGPGRSFHFDESSSITGAGNLRFLSDTVTVDGTCDVSGTTAVMGGTVQFTQDATLGTLNLGTGTLTTAGTLTTSGPLTWTGGTINGPGQITAAAGLTIGGTGSKTLDGTTLENAGRATWGGTGNLFLDDDAVLSNRAGAVFDSQADTTLSGSGTFRNAGSFIKSGGGLITLGTAFDNTGSVDVRAGTVSLTGDFVNAGTLTVGPDSTFFTPGAYVQTAGTTTLAGGTLRADGLVDLEGGLFNGTGTLQGSVVNNAEIDVGQPGSPGVLTITGDYSGGGTLVIEIGGTNPGSDFDQLLIGGRATFAGGTLAVHLINGFVPDPTTPDRFPVLTFGAHDPADDFATYNGLDLGGGLGLTPTYDGGSLTLVATSGGGAPEVSGQDSRGQRPATTEAGTPAAQSPGATSLGIPPARHPRGLTSSMIACASARVEPGSHAGS